MFHGCDCNYIPIINVVTEKDYTPTNKSWLSICIYIRGVTTNTETLITLSKLTCHVLSMELSEKKTRFIIIVKHGGSAIAVPPLKLGFEA